MAHGRFKKRSRGRRLGHSTSPVRTLVVYVDGEKTEAEYFRGWRRKLGSLGLDLRTFTIRSGGNVLEAVEASLKKMLADDEAEEFWCVCDVDDTTLSDLSKALAIARKHKMRVCLSRRSFEVWIALHWDRISTAEIANEQQARRLVATRFPAYRRGPKLVPFDVLFPLTDDAITNAEWLERQGCANPSTTVHELVRELLPLVSS